LSQSKCDTFNIFLHFIESDFRRESVISQIAAFDLQRVGVFRKLVRLRVKTQKNSKKLVKK